MAISNDEEHIKLLSIFHYIVGGIGCMFSCLPLLHVALGLFLVFSGEHLSQNGGEAPPAFVGWIFTVLGVGAFLMGQALSISMIISGRYLSKRRKYMFSFIVACIACMLIPFGTVLGIFTIIVLSKESVKQLYDRAI